MAAASRSGEVLLVADTIGKSYDGEKELFSGLTFSVRCAAAKIFRGRHIWHASSQRYQPAGSAHVAVIRIYY